MFGLSDKIALTCVRCMPKNDKIDFVHFFAVQKYKRKLLITPPILVKNS